MIKTVELKLKPEEVDNAELIRKRAIHLSKLPKASVQEVRVIRKSIDARGFHPVYRLKVEVYSGESYQPEPALLTAFDPLPDNAPEVIIIGAGPAGYFAALKLIESGVKPVVLDRGKDVQARRRDLRAIQQLGEVNPHSNYCFGEGGAGTYSDGKLYTRSHKRGNILEVLKLLVEHGAKDEILIDAHPHIGSNKLPKIVANIRETILHYGGEIHFNSHVTDFLIRFDQIKGVVINGKEERFGQAVILATGHSARDIFDLLLQKNIKMEAKPFALGVRIEHPQPLIDKIQYNKSPRGEHLPASSYKLTCQVDGRGVFSFCMCPGGLVVPTATAPGEIVVNGMSLSRRDSPYANSGTVVAIELEDLAPYQSQGILAGLAFQKAVEQNMFKSGDGSQKAPAQRLPDFVNGKVSNSLPDSSYIPGLFAAPLHKLLPEQIYDKLKKGVITFGKKMKGYMTQEAVVIGTESRTSSPIRIPRDSQKLMHEQVRGLFPCGEGAGYAGGILSAAMDGQRVAKAVALFIKDQ